MKIQNYLIVFVAAAIQVAAAQVPPPSATPAAPQASGGPGVPPILRERMREHFLKNLSEPDRRRFEESREKANRDPEIAKLREKAELANKAYFEAVRAKIREMDPGLEEVIQKAMQERWKKGKGWHDKGDKEYGKKQISKLSEDEKSRLDSAQKIARSTPAVQKADEQRRAAQTPEERRAAASAYRQAMREAILAADPSLKEVLEKLRQDQ